MREILFRGKRLDNGEWIEGCLIYIDNQYYIADYDKMMIPFVDPKTVGQFTGFLDKDGKKIFEGDCVGCRGNIVIFTDGTFTINGDRPLSFHKNLYMFKVVGNIFDSGKEN